MCVLNPVRVLDRMGLSESRCYGELVEEGFEPAVVLDDSERTGFIQIRKKAGVCGDGVHQPRYINLGRASLCRSRTFPLNPACVSYRFPSWEVDLRRIQ